MIWLSQGLGYVDCWCGLKRISSTITPVDAVIAFVFPQFCGRG